ncbi:telomere-protecting terminal protein Tpg [Streptomyces sp. NPDC058193]|uniref:telomere-protecting terminal protein Tpg n=1 Tax=Streptomyces sp. NPDC058193 TaxID=3346373 RepID=UPI0036EC62FB
MRERADRGGPCGRTDPVDRGVPRSPPTGRLETGVGQIGQGLERVLRTRPVPSSTEARLRFLLTAHRGSTRRVAAHLGVSQRTVQRWVTTKSPARRRPGPRQVRAIEEAVLARWQPRIRARLRARAEAEGIVLHTRARFGFTAPAGSSDDPGCGGSPRTGPQRSPGSCSPHRTPARARSSRR